MQQICDFGPGIIGRGVVMRKIISPVLAFGFHPVSTLRTWGKHLGNGGVVDKKMSIPGLKHQHRTVPPPKAAPAVATDQPAAADDLRLGDSNSRLAAAKLGSRAPSLSLGGLG